MPEMCQAGHVPHHRHREGEAARVPLLRRARPPAPAPARGGGDAGADQRAGQEADRQRTGGRREPSAADKQVCPVCQITFLEFRNSGRLGCPYDYEVFRDELMPLLENIHDETRHSGKVPKRAPAEQPAADDADPAPQRAEAGRRGRGLRDGRPAPRQDQGRSSRSRDDDDAPSRRRLARAVTLPGGRLMICQRCQNEASVHLTETVDGQRRELHLCAGLRRKAGLSLPESPPEPGARRRGPEPDRGPRRRAGRRAGRADLPRLRHQVHGVPGRRPARLPARLPGLRAAACSRCCSGSTARPGTSARRPGRGPGAADRLRLRTQLREAIAREDYEEAARLRDQLRLKDADA